MGTGSEQPPWWDSTYPSSLWEVLDRGGIKAGVSLFSIPVPPGRFLRFPQCVLRD